MSDMAPPEVRATAIYTVPQLATAVGASSSFIMGLINSGRLIAHRNGGRGWRRIHGHDYLNYLHSRAECVPTKPISDRAWWREKDKKARIRIAKKVYAEMELTPPPEEMELQSV